jgi:hypothetical protein
MAVDRWREIVEILESENGWRTDAFLLKKSIQNIQYYIILRGKTPKLVQDRELFGK